MIIQQNVTDLQRSGLMGETAFGIALSPKIYGILTDRLYSDPVGSVVREVCSNAWDAHKMKAVASGEDMEPFKITIPTDFDPHFVVEDFGPGMKDEDALSLYSTLGLSTKEGCNEQIGAFGLGSKSPLAVTDTFTIENIHEGIAYHYVCFKAEDGMPSILKTGQNTSEEKYSGVKIMIPVGTGSYSLYLNAVSRQLTAMEPKPIITNGKGFQFIEDRIVVKNDSGAIRVKSNGKMSGYYAKMGMVLYPIPRDNIPEPRIIGDYPYNHYCVLEMPIGAVEPQPNREGLIFNKRTLAAIKDAHETLITKTTQQFKDELKEITTPIETWKYLGKLIDSEIDPLIYRECSVEVNGYRISTVRKYHSYLNVNQPQEEFVKDVEEFDEEGNVVTVQKTFKRDKYVFQIVRPTPKRVNISGLNVLSFSNVEGIASGQNKLILMDTNKMTRKTDRLLNALEGNSGYLINMNAGDFDFTEIVKELELVYPDIQKHIIKFSDLEIPKPKPRDKKPTKLRGIKFRSTNGYTESVTDMEELEELFDENSLNNKNTCWLSVDSAGYLRDDEYRTITVGHADEILRKVGMNAFYVSPSSAKRVRQYLEDQEIPEFSDLLVELIPDMGVSDDINYLKYLALRGIHYHRHTASIKSLGQELKKLYSKDGHPFPEYLKLYSELSIYSTEHTSSFVFLYSKLINGAAVITDRVKEQLRKRFDSYAYTENVQEIEEAFYNKYPLFRYIEGTDAEHSLIYDYLVMVDKSQ